jgi:hypothetical protein
MRLAYWGALVVALGGCGSGSGSGPHACTLVGCADMLVVTLHDANGALPSGTQTITVTAGGATTTCTFTFLPATATGSGSPSCPVGLGVQISQATHCVSSGTPGYMTQTCTPVPGKFNEVVAIGSTPAMAHLTVAVDGTTYLDETLIPAYTTSRPNGPDCDPVCTQGSAELVLAAQ